MTVDGGNTLVVVGLVVAETCCLVDSFVVVGMAVDGVTVVVVVVSGCFVVVVSVAVFTGVDAEKWLEAKFRTT